MWDEFLFNLFVVVPIIIIEVLFSAFVWRRVVVNLPLFSGYTKEEGEDNEDDEEDEEKELNEAYVAILIESVTALEIELEDMKERQNFIESKVMSDDDG